MTPDLIYGLTGIAVFGIGLIGALCARDRLRRVLALKLCSVGRGSCWSWALGASRRARPIPSPMRW